jgi:transcriptional regulator with XRE-family HTH domain
MCYDYPMMGNRLKHIITREKVTAYRICKDLGINQGHFSRFLKGEASFSLEKLERIADYLGYDIEYVKRRPSRERSE